MPPTESALPRKRSSRARKVIGVSGELLITIGILLLLFVVWQLKWTDFLAARAHDLTRESLQQEWTIGASAAGEPATVKTTYGKPFGLMYIPRLRDRAWGVPIIEGTEHYLLSDGVGHHPESSMPGEYGNFAVAGHRTTYGAPFADIDGLEPGDQVIVETKTGWYVYELDKHTIINYWEGWVLDPVPGKPRKTQPTAKLITIYACHPKYSAAQRYVWFGHLVDEYPKSEGEPPAIQKYGRR
jgi:sortase A